MNSKKVTDHHAIIPTVQIAKGLKGVSEREMKVLHLIAARMLCATGKNHVYVTQAAQINCEGESFKVTNKVIADTGFKVYEDSLQRYYKNSLMEEEEDCHKSELSIKKGDVLNVEKAVMKEGFTSPPKHYTEDGLLKAMEKAGAKDMDDDVERKGLGTPATRADIIVPFEER